MWDWITTAQVPVVKRIPRAHRLLWADLLTDALRGIAEVPLECNQWKRLLALPKLVLRLPQLRANGRASDAIIQTHISGLLHRARNGEWASLFHDARYIRPPPRGRATDRTLAARVIALVQEGMLSKAVQMLGTNGLHSFTPEIVEVLRAKHPISHTVTPPHPDPMPEFIEFRPEDMRRAIAAFHSASAPGASRFRPSHFKDALNIPTGDHGERITKALASVCSILAQGQAPGEIAPWLAGAPVYPLRKPDGGVRPIAVGETLRRIVSRALCARHKYQFAELLLPAGQVGVGIPSGAEAAVIAVREKLRKEMDFDRVAVLKVDFGNAFNTASRTAMLRVVARDIPEILPWAEFCYAEPANLFGEEHVLPFASSSGVQQGDPLGPFLFAMCLRRVCLRLRRELG